jgi:hypothetical protein
MNARPEILSRGALTHAVDVLKIRPEARAHFEYEYQFEHLADAVDPLQEYAESSGLVAAIGQDAVQAIIAEPFARRRAMATDDDCADLSPDEMTLHDLELRAELRCEEEVAAIFARLEAMDDPSKRLPTRGRTEPYHPAQSTIEAFGYLTAAGDLGRIREWLGDRPKDAPHLVALLEGQDHA